MALVWENVSWGDNHLRAKKKKKPLKNDTAFLKPHEDDLTKIGRVFGNKSVESKKSI